MRITLVISLVLSLWSVPSIAREVVLGFVDLPVLIDKSPQSIAAGKRLEKEFAPRQKALEQDRDALDKMRDQLEKESLIMTETQRSGMELNIHKFERRLKREEQDFREELNIKKNNEFKKVRQLVLEAILKFASQGEYDMVLSEGVLFAHQRVDVTEQVIEVMKEIKKSDTESSQ